MEENSSPDLLGIRPISKAVEKLTDKTIDGIGSFFGAICMPVAEEFGLLLKDKISDFRSKNLKSIADKTKEKIENKRIKITGQTSPILIREIFGKASWCEDENIQSMWAGLLSVAAGNTAKSDDSLIYTDILNRLTSFQAQLINAIYSDPRCCSINPPAGLYWTDAFYPENKLIFTPSEILKIFPGDLSEMLPMFHKDQKEILSTEEDHIIALSRFRPQITQLKTVGLIHDVKFLNNYKDGVYFIPNLKGLDFFMRCLGDYIYPLEAYIAMMQHLNKEYGIDPFEYSKDI